MQDWQGSLTLVWQPVQEKENTDIKPALFHILPMVEGLGK